VKVYPFLRRVSSFSGRLLALSLLISLLLSFFWLAGNVQSFLDTTQAAILACLRWALLVELAAAAWTAAILVARTVLEHRLFPVRFILAALSFAAGVVLLTSLGFFRAWLRF